VAGLNWLMGFQPSLLDNWISNDKTVIKKRKKKTLHIFTSTLKEQK
jgi:hypothetical protein